MDNKGVIIQMTKRRMMATYAPEVRTSLDIMDNKEVAMEMTKRRMMATYAPEVRTSLDIMDNKEVAMEMTKKRITKREVNNIELWKYVKLELIK